MLTVRLLANEHKIIFFNKNRLFFFLFLNVQNFPSQPIASLCYLNSACKLQMDRNSAILVEYEGKLIASVKAHTTMPNS